MHGLFINDTVPLSTHMPPRLIVHERNCSAHNHFYTYEIIVEKISLRVAELERNAKLQTLKYDEPKTLLPLHAPVWAVRSVCIRRVISSLRPFFGLSNVFYIFHSKLACLSSFAQKWQAWCMQQIHACATKQLKGGTLKPVTCVFIVLINFWCNSSEPKMTWNGLDASIYTTRLQLIWAQCRGNSGYIEAECLQSKGSVDSVILITHSILFLCLSPNILPCKWQKARAYTQIHDEHKMSTMYVWMPKIGTIAYDAMLERNGGEAISFVKWRNA